MTDLPTNQPDAPTFPASFLEDIGFVVNKVGERINRQIERVLSPHGLNVRQYGLLLLLQARGAQAQIELSQQVGVDRTTVMRTVDLLEAQGMVRRDPDSSDRRKHSVAITDTGLELLVRTRPAVQRAKEKITTTLSKQQQADLLRLLRPMLESETEI
jgi:MarR family transcriptional regulator, lower aerobic nicotinate degradation pathway regulator